MNTQKRSFALVSELGTSMFRALTLHSKRLIRRSHEYHKPSKNRFIFKIHAKQLEIRECTSGTRWTRIGVTEYKLQMSDNTLTSTNKVYLAADILSPTVHSQRMNCTALRGNAASVMKST
jgi:hypothetical protein